MVSVGDERELLEVLRTLWDLALVVVSIRSIGEAGPDRDGRDRVR